MSRVRCCNCKFSIATSSSEKVWLCDNPDLKSYGKNVCHGSKFACGYGVDWKDAQNMKPHNHDGEGE